MNPLRNRKGGIGNPPATVGAPEFYPNGTKTKVGYSQGEPEARLCNSPEGRVSTVRWDRRACGEGPGRNRGGYPIDELVGLCQEAL